MLVRDAMTKRVVTLRRESPLLQASKVLVSKRVGGAPVVDDEGRVVGLLSESDVVRALKGPLEALKKSERLESKYKGMGDSSLARDALGVVSLDWLWYVWNMHAVDKIFNELRKSEALPAVKVRDAMTKNVFTVRPDDSTEKALEMMNDHNVNRLPVVDSKRRLVGIIARADLLKVVSSELLNGLARR